MEIENGEIHFRNFRKPEVDIYLRSIRAVVKNLTNSADLNESKPATADASGYAMGDAPFTISISIDPFSDLPEFDLNATLSDLDVTLLNNFMRHYGKFDLQRGTFSLAMEAVAEEGQLKGYVKPVFRNLDVVSLEKDDENPLKLFWEAIVGAVSEIFENQPRDQLATKIPLEGKFEEPDTDILPIIGGVLKNAFIQAFLPRIEHSVGKD